MRPVPTGIDHGTVTVIADGIAHEVTTFRRDVATDGRRAVVAYSTDLAEDARRRDFTMNALYAEADGSLVDPLGGLADLQGRRVRFIEDVGARIAEDRLRILRFFRFYAWYGDPAEGLDPEGLAACAAAVEGLGALSRERVGAEMLKLLAAPDPAPAVAAFAAPGGLSRVLPGAEPRLLPVIVALEAAAGLAPDPLRRLAALGGAEAADRLRLSRKDAKRLADVALALQQGETPEVAAYRHGAAVAQDAALIVAASLGQPAPAGLTAQARRGTARRFPVRPADLMPGLEGPALGRRLRRLEERWIGSGFRLTRADLLGDLD
jgi:poly(A) polymerase